MHIDDGPRVLLVEDRPDEGEILQMTLQDHGFLVRYVPGAEEALAGLAQWTGRALPEVIIFNLRLPGMGSAGLSVALRRHPDWQRIPRVLMTDMVVAPHEEGALGVNEIFQKPLDVQALLSGLHRLTGRPAAPSPERTRA